jgi:Flp pilus assembly protein TadD
MLDISTSEGLADAMLHHGVTLASIKGISTEDLECFYAAACARMSNGNPADAIEDLMLLVTHEPWDRRFQFAYGLALQLVGQYEAACRHYGQALLLDATDAGCVLRIAECLEASGDSIEAEDAYRACIDLSWSDAKWQDVRSFAETGMSRITTNGGMK